MHNSGVVKVKANDMKFFREPPLQPSFSPKSRIRIKPIKLKSEVSIFFFFERLVQEIYLKASFLIFNYSLRSLTCLRQWLVSAEDNFRTQAMAGNTFVFAGYINYSVEIVKSQND